ncbi:AbrB/MazE/SpoVT family DNA-binding domain-containing protein [Methanobrevibacter curvatus]|uniref:SpoVT-AbrB domain-containing protein n=1 Tax=Methanobrevibacter curvatus TaxID=49547 RepID=A0A162FJK9_9EURY|nr:AbrB/MazE/SpoVT family DNA-binding domain-containing protein [Methanobrevibacter curvatus]KZX10960.1 hypothetical protein MBCUR_16250 [Methanobrevibacter curvatus]
MTMTTKIYKGFQTVIPSEIRKKLNIEIEDIVEWFMDEKGNINLEFRKKTGFYDIKEMGEAPYNTDAVKLKKMVARGKKP